MLKWLSFRLAYFAGKEAMEKKRWEEAEKKFKKALEIFPFQLEAMMALAQVSWKLEKKQEAYFLLEKLVQNQPELSQAYFLHGLFCTEEGKLKEALGSLKKSTSLELKNGEAWYEMGKICIKLKEDHEALLAFRQATQMEPSAVLWCFQNLKEKLKSKAMLL